MPTKKKKSPKVASPRVAHVDFHVDQASEFRRYVKYLSSPWHIMWRNFLAGTFKGLGFVLGSAIVITVLGYVLGSVLSSITIFQNLSEALSIWLENTVGNGF